MDAFYASVEQRDFPELKGKCIAVGGSSDRGVVATASYEARLYGVKSAMPSVIAKRKCPKLIFVKPRFEVYKEVSNQIRAIFKEYTDLIEPLSLDEAYLDVTINKKGIQSATQIAKEIKQKIKEATHLTASAGVSFNKFLAKIASDYNKPDGLFVVTPTIAESFVEKLQISKFHGIGKITANKMQNLGVYNGKDLKKLSLEKLLKEFGKSGLYYYNVVRAIDNRLVDSTRIRKSVGSEQTFKEDLNSLSEIKQNILPLINEVWSWNQKNLIFGRTFTVKLKYNDFKVINRSKTTLSIITDFNIFKQIVIDLLSDCFQNDKLVRLLGISVSNLSDLKSNEGKQLELNFPNINI